MKLLLSLSLGENEQGQTVTVIDSYGNEQTLHAEGGQCQIDVADGDTVTISENEAKPKTRKK